MNRGAVKCLVINLASASARREYITRHLAALGIPFELVAAVDVRSLSAAELAANYDRRKALRYGNDLSLPEIGCALSHLNIYRRMLAADIGHALILEDDAKLKPETLPVVEKLRRLYPADREALILLTYIRHYAQRGARPVDDTHLVAEIRAKHCGGTHGYFITNAAARRMVAALHPVWQVADQWLQFRAYGIMRARTLVPYVIGTDTVSETSSIGNERERVRRLPANRKTIGRFFRRYINTGLPAYWWRRIKAAAFNARYNKRLEQPDNF
ncbi:MAG: glycosyltransferase family 25 protein [Verrucomicrobiales bacterium]|nr:glycosyltransferase family 25 protein [Verrucomicrobiales bacterium]